MRKLIIILIALIVFIVGCRTAPEIKREPVRTEMLETKVEEVSKLIQGSDLNEKAEQAIKDAEQSLEIANQVIPFKDKFDSKIRTLVSYANELIAEAWKAYEVENYWKALVNANRAKIASDKSIVLIREIIDKVNEEKRVIAFREISKAQRDGKETFEAENYMEQKNYDEVLRVIGYAEKKKKRKVIKQVQVKKSKRQIVRNDSLWDIALELYGDGFEWRKLWEANKHIKNPNKIYPGQVLNTP